MVQHEKYEKKDETFTIKKTALWQGTTAFFGFLLIISIFTGGFGFGSDGSSGSSGGRVVVQQPTAAAPSAPTAPRAPAPTARVEVDIGDSPFQGDENAPVTLVEFSDFQCPFCSRFLTQTKGQIDEAYVKTGKVKFVYMHFPLESIHPQAMPAALASECADEQGAFWEYHDLVFQNQQSLSDANYKQWAGQLSLDQAQFDDCYDSKKYESAVRGDLQQGSNAGVRGTPGFILNGQLISGAQPFAVFQQAIDAALAN